MATTTIHIDGDIGWDITARDVRNALSGAGDIDLLIHSPGGSVPEGLAIYNALRDHRRAGHAIHARVVGYAASMATGLAMAADTLEVEDNAIWMIHNPLGIEIGDYRAMRKYGDLLDSLARVLAKQYADKTGRDLNAIRQEMDDETWLFGQEIVDAGFADALTPAGDGPESQPEALAVARASFDAMKAKLREASQADADQIAALMPLTTEVTAMSKDTQNPAAATDREPQTDQTPPVEAPQADPQAAIQAAIATERQRVAGITARCTQVGMSALAQALIDSGADMAACNAAIVDAYVAKGGAEIQQPTKTAPPANRSIADWSATIAKLNARRA